MVKEDDLSFRLAITEISKLIKRTDFSHNLSVSPPPPDNFKLGITCTCNFLYLFFILLGLQHTNIVKNIYVTVIVSN